MIVYNACTDIPGFTPFASADIILHIPWEVADAACPNSNMEELVLGAINAKEKKNPREQMPPPMEAVY